MAKIYFTVKQAEKLLPEIEKLLKNLINLREAIYTISTIDIEYEDVEEEIHQENASYCVEYRIRYI